jgi:D-lactate dehydrogenase (cytochrome)
MRTITDPDVIAGYLTDASNTTGHAEALVRPESTAEVAEVLAHCQAESIPLTVTAQRTSTTGGPVPQGGWLLSMERLSAVMAPDHVQAGVLLGEHQRTLAEQGRLFPPDPTSRHECTIGAAIACNASGARSFCYGPTRPWVKAIEFVDPCGRVHQADRSTPIPAAWPQVRWGEPRVKTAAGLYPADNLLDLMIGQEGILGVITEAHLVLTEQPPGVLSLIAFFADLPTALSCVDRARAGAERPGQPALPGALSPCAIEFFDHHALAMVRNRVPGIPEEARCALFIEVIHSGEPPLEPWWETLVESGALAEHTIVAEDPPSRARLHAVRHAVPAGVNETVVANSMPKVGTDFAVPDGALAEMMAAYAAVPLPQVLFGHIGDNHLHLNLLPSTPQELKKAREAYTALARLAISLGGTVSAEHGIGKIKRGLLAELVGQQTLAQFHALKAAVDPAWILGRGTMLAPPTSDP